jgi:hypothetical protein
VQQAFEKVACQQSAFVLQGKLSPILDLTLISDLDELATMAVMDDYPRPLSNGPRAGKLWANATNAAGKNGVIAINQKRFTIAVSEQRWQDAATVR